MCCLVHIIFIFCYAEVFLFLRPPVCACVCVCFFDSQCTRSVHMQNEMIGPALLCAPWVVPAQSALTPSQYPISCLTTSPSQLLQLNKQNSRAGSHSDGHHSCAPSLHTHTHMMGHIHTHTYNRSYTHTHRHTSTDAPTNTLI